MLCVECMYMRGVCGVRGVWDVGLVIGGICV
jgi:hypothetical protein